jgi:hypothetical protein
VRGDVVAPSLRIVEMTRGRVEGSRDGPRGDCHSAEGPPIAPAAAGERSERRPGRTWRAAAPPLCPAARRWRLLLAGEIAGQATTIDSLATGSNQSRDMLSRQERQDAKSAKQKAQASG